MRQPKSKREPTCSMKTRVAIAFTVKHYLPGTEIDWTSGHGVFVTHGRSFGSITREGHLALKLPPDRIETLVGLGEAQLFRFGERVVENTIVVPAQPDTFTLDLLREAKAYAEREASKPKRTRTKDSTNHTTGTK